MRRSTSIAVALAVAVVAAVAGLAFRSAQRDRDALLAAFGDEHLSRLRIAIREIEAELADVAQHLEFATRLVESAKSGADQRRELEALLAVVRAYRMIAVYDAAGRQRVLAVDPLAPPSWSPAPLEPQLAAIARTAMSRRGMTISPPLEEPGSPWNRAFATPLVRDGAAGAVVILVDLQSVFERLRLVAADPGAKLILLGPHGRPAPLTDASLAVAAAAPDREGAFAGVLERMGRGHAGSAPIPERDANGLGLGAGDAVAVFAPIPVSGAAHWSAAVLSSTGVLRVQERAIALRMGVLGAAFVLALGALSVYLVWSARRTIAVQERLRSAEQVAHLSSQLLRAEKLATVGVLAAGIAHEIGTPLGVVRGRAEILLAKLGAASTLGGNARIIVDEIDRISRTIQELLDFSRTSRAASVAVPLGAIAANVVELLAFEARRRKVSLAVDVSPELPALAADPDQLKQVLVNLTLNALDASAPGGRVTLRAQANDGARALIEVVDEGAGIPEALRHRVFDPFFTTKKRGKGTGLGLTVAARIVRDHGGEIDLQSAEARGTRVTVVWPLAGAAEESHGEAEGRAHPGGR